MPYKFIMGCFLALTCFFIVFGFFKGNEAMSQSGLYSTLALLVGFGIGWEGRFEKIENDEWVKRENERIEKWKQEEQQKSLSKGN